MRILGLDAALTRCAVALADDGSLRGERIVDLRQGQPSLLPGLVQAVLDMAAMRPGDLDLIAVTVGPGSFTGIRSALAFSHGLAAGLGIPVIGVTVGEALAVSLRHLRGREFWCVTDSRRGHVFLERDGTIVPVSLDGLPQPTGPIAVAGDAAPVVASRLAAQGHDVLLTDLRLPLPLDVATVGQARLQAGGRVPPARPLYVEGPAARSPEGGLRPAPRP